MSKVKAIAAALLISVCASTVSFAEVNNFHEEDTNWKIDYPVVTVGANESAQDAINSDIMNYVGQLRSDFESGKYLLVCQTYVTPCLMKSWSVSFGDFHPSGRIGKQL